MNFKITQQTSAEDDSFLIECFEESYFIRDLLQNNFSVILGRKGTGKTAIAKFLQASYRNYDLEFAHRISISELHGSLVENTSEQIEILLFFIIARTIQLLVKQNLFTRNGKIYWESFLAQNGLENVEDYKSFVEWTKSNKLGSSIEIPVIKGDGEFTKEYVKSKINNSTGSLFHSLGTTLKQNKRIIILIDDISDYLDKIKLDQLETNINLVRDVLLSLDRQNAVMRENDVRLSFITCLRDDIFEKMPGSNINKLENNSLKLAWTEETFCRLLIKRLPFYSDNLDQSLADPIKSIMEYFPNKIFKGKVEEFETKHYATNFYAYMMAISFNRPRDFLKYCYCMRNRLSLGGINFDQLEASEIEYSDYLIKELKDELGMTSVLRGFGSDIDSVKELVQRLSNEYGFGYAQLRTEMSQYLNKKSSHSSVTDFIRDLWWYGILGFRKSLKDTIAYKYFNNVQTFLSESQLKEYTYYLHRGITWALKKKTAL